MVDLIERQAAIEAARKCSVKEVTPDYMLIDKAEIMTGLMMLPSAQPEMKKGKWVKIPGMNEYCSACNQFFPLSYFQGRPFEINYCPNCGAKMEEKQYE